MTLWTVSTDQGTTRRRSTRGAFTDDIAQGFEGINPSSTAAERMWRGWRDNEPVTHRLDFRGNRRINSVLYIASVTQQRDRHDGQAYIDRKTTEGKTRREARRSHKRHLANRVIRRMWRDEQARSAGLTAVA